MSRSVPVDAAACRAFRDTGTRKHSYVLRTRATQKGDSPFCGRTTSMRLGRGSASPWTAAPDLPFLCQVLLVVIALAIAGLSHAQSNFACENCDDLKEAGTPMTMRASE